MSSVLWGDWWYVWDESEDDLKLVNSGLVQSGSNQIH